MIAQGRGGEEKRREEKERKIGFARYKNHGD